MVPLRLFSVSDTVLLGISGLVHFISFHRILQLMICGHLPTCHQGDGELGFRHYDLLSQRRSFLTWTRTRVRSVFQDLMGCFFFSPGSLTVKSQRPTTFQQYNPCLFQSTSEPNESSELSSLVFIDVKNCRWPLNYLFLRSRVCKLPNKGPMVSLAPLNSALVARQHPQTKQQIRLLCSNKIIYKNRQQAGFGSWAIVC